MKHLQSMKLQILLFAFCCTVIQLNAHFTFTPIDKNVDKLKNSKILVYTKNGKGFVHDNIASSIECIKQLGMENLFKVDVSDDPSLFTEDNLKQYTLLLFASTNNDVFDNDQQRLAFRRYIEAGGGFVGLHSVTGTERNWTWFKMMVGETFTWHANFQKFNIINIDPKHPSMKGMPAIWTKEDECYFGKELYPGMKVLMMHEIASLDPKQQDLIQKNQGLFGPYFPAVWYQDFQGGHIWITTLGHDKNNYQNPQFKNHILQGISFIANQISGIHFEKAKALDRNEPIHLVDMQP